MIGKQGLLMRIPISSFRLLRALLIVSRGCVVYQFSNGSMSAARPGDRRSISLHQSFRDRLKHEAAFGAGWWPMVDEVRCEARSFAR